MRNLCLFQLREATLINNPVIFFSHMWCIIRYYGHAFEQALGDRAGQGNLACCIVHGALESDMT